MSSPRNNHRDLPLVFGVQKQAKRAVQLNLELAQYGTELGQKLPVKEGNRREVWLEVIALRILGPASDLLRASSRRQERLDSLEVRLSRHPE